MLVFEGEFSLRQMANLELISGVFRTLHTPKILHLQQELIDYSPDSHCLCVCGRCRLLFLLGLDHGGGCHGLVHGLHVNKSAEKSKQMNVNKCSNLHGRLEALVAAPRVA